MLDASRNNQYYPRRLSNYLNVQPDDVKTILLPVSPFPIDHFTMDGDTTEILSAPSAQTGGSGLPSHEDLTPKEQAVLEEYERLAENMKKVGPFSPFDFVASPLPHR